MQMLSRAFALLFLLSACGVALTVPTGAAIECATDADCPDGMPCGGNNRCVSLGTNEPPTVTLGMPAGAAPGRPLNLVTLRFTVADLNGPPLGHDTVALTFEWSAPTVGVEPTQWRAATAHSSSAPTVDLGGSAPLVGDFVWDARADVTTAGLPHELVDTDGDGNNDTDVVDFLPRVFLRGVATDSRGAESEPSVTPSFSLGNRPPTVVLDPISTTVAGLVPLGFTVNDPATDPATIDLQFRTNSGDGWRAMRIVLGSTDNLFAPPNGAPHVVVWDSSAPTNSVLDTPQGVGANTLETVELRVRAEDEPETGVTHFGLWSDPSSLPEVRNQTAPFVAELMLPRADLAGGSSPIPIQFRIVDAERDPVDARFTYSLDGGVTFQTCREYASPLSEGRKELLAAPADNTLGGGVWHTFIWDASGIVFTRASSTRVRVAVADRIGQETTLETGLGFPIGPTAQAGSYSAFGAYSTVPAGTFAHSNAVADFNEDGITDIAVGLDYNDPPIGSSQTTIKVLLGNGAAGVGNGTFTAGTPLNTNYGVASLAAGDLNGDHHADLVSLEFCGTWDSPPSARVVRVFLGRGNGTFDAAITITDPSVYARTVRLGDLNGDGLLDLVINSSGTAYIALGDGTGHFGAAQALPGANSPSLIAATDALAIADLNADSAMDVVVANQGNDELAVYLGHGNGAFDLAGIFAVGAWPTGIVTGDFNQDGVVDLATSNFNSNDVTVLVGTGGSGTAMFTAATSYNAGSSPSGVAVVDVSRDGVADLIVTNQGSNNLAVLVGLGSGSASLFSTPSFYATGDAPVGIVPARLDGDGLTDLVVGATNGYNSNIYVLLSNRESPVPSFASPVPLARNAVLSSIAVADLDGDGIQDLIASGHSVFDYHGVGIGGVGAGRFDTPLPLAAGPDDDMASTAVGDLNGDGRPDVVVAISRNSTFDVYLGRGTTSTSDAGFELVESLPAELLAWRVALADLDNNGTLDIAFIKGVLSSGPSPVCCESVLGVYVNNGNDGDGKPVFSSAIELPQVGLYQYGLVAADFNSDGWLDLAMATSSQATQFLFGVRVYLNEMASGGTFSNEIYTVGDETNQGMCVADLNDDGKPDLVVSPRRSASDGHLQVLLGKGDGSFNAGAWYSPGGGSGDALTELVCADFDADGVVDVAAANAPKSEVVLYVGHAVGGVGDGTLVLAGHFAAGPGAGGLALVDANLDGMLDVVTSAPSVLLGQLESRTVGFGRRLVPLADIQMPSSERRAYLYGTAATSQETTLFGELARDERVAERLWPVGAAYYEGIGRDLVSAAIVAPPHLRPVTAPWYVPEVARFERVAGEALGDDVGGMRLCVIPTPYDLRPTAPTGSSGLVIELPILAARSNATLGGGVRLFRRETDWLRALEVPEDPLVGSPDPAERCLPRVSALNSPGYRDLIVPLVRWTEVNVDPDSDLETGSGERFIVDTTDPERRRILALVERTGLFQAFLTP